MAALPIVEIPDPRLRAPTEPVDPDDPELDALLEAMFASMYAAKGIGLAAPQIGVLKRVFITDLGTEETGPLPEHYLNPEIVLKGEETDTAEEGCLSIPGQYGDVTRPSTVTLRAQRKGGEIVEVAADGLLARCLQHELDHLHGVLFIDHMSMLKRKMLLRKLDKKRRQEAAEA